MDLGANGGNEFTPAYAIYENGTPARIALFNYVTDASGASDYTASVSVGDATPGSVKVKYVDCCTVGLSCADVLCRYLSADSVSQKANFTWAGQVSNLFVSECITPADHSLLDLRRCLWIRW